MKYIVLAIFILILICLIIVIRDTNRFVFKKYEFTNDKITDSFRFILLSDLHNKSFGNENEKLLKAIEERNPDAILCAGDILTAKPGRDFQVAAKLINELAEKYPLYYGNGNHEYRIKLYPENYGDMAKEYEKALNTEKFFWLINDKQEIPEKNIVIYGLEIEREYYKRFHKEIMKNEYIPALLGPIKEDACTILIGHNPEYFKQYAEYGADFVLAGHVHGGVARLPLLGGVISPSLRLFPKYDGGIFKSKKPDGKMSTMILSRGLGCHTIPVRFLNPGELIEVTITPEK